MSSTSAFDPYYNWLGIPPKDQPPHYYRLLGLEPFEQNANVIANMAEQRMLALRTFSLGPHGSHSQKLLNEVAAAKVCLLNPEEKAEYDARLRAHIPVSSVATYSRSPAMCLPASEQPAAVEPLPSHPPLASIKMLTEPLFADDAPATPQISNPELRRVPITRQTSSRRRSSPLIEVAKIVVGGAVGIALALLIITVMRGAGWFERDAKNAASADRESSPMIGGTEARSDIDANPQAIAGRESTPMIGAIAGEERSDNELALRLVWCPPGTFVFGSPPSESGRDAEEFQASISLTRGFWLGKCEVSQKQWRQLMSSEPWDMKPGVTSGDQYPATFVSWDNSVEFCRILTALERNAGRLPRQWEFALPTEAQWEYACRATTTTRFSFGSDETELSKYAWYEHNAGSVGEEYAHETGRKRANPFGLHDMHGNVWEWCADWYDSHFYTHGPLKDPEGPSSGAQKTVRGGAWNHPATSCRSAYRGRVPPSQQAGDLGFRVGLFFTPEAEGDRNKRDTHALGSPLISIALSSRRSSFVQHSDYEAHTGRVRNLNAIFELAPGLSDPKGVSFRSLSPPNHYLAHGDFRLRLAPWDNSAEGARNATFHKVKGLSSPTAVSFEAAERPGHFLRSRDNGEIWLDKNDGSDQFRRDATFVIVAPAVPWR